LIKKRGRQNLVLEFGAIIKREVKSVIGKRIA